MLRLKEVASQSETFPKRALEKQNVNRTLLLPRPATGRTLQLFSIDRPPLLAVIPARANKNAQGETVWALAITVPFLPITKTHSCMKPEYQYSSAHFIQS